jgi:malate dehydrogenase (oxaloacetate-decarboxylating)
MAAAKALAECSPARADPKGNLLPPVSALRQISLKVARAVALQAGKEGLAEGGVRADQVDTLIQSKVWTPRYLPYRRVQRRQNLAP